MIQLYRLATNESLDLHTRYEIVRTMLLLRKPVKKRNKRNHKEEYRRRREMYGV